MPCEVVLLRVDFFQNGCRCHGNGQNAKQLKNTKMIIAGYSPNKNWWNLIGTTSTSSGTRSTKKIGIGRTNFAAVAMEIKKGGFKKKKLISFMKHRRNIHCSVWKLLADVAMVTKVQKLLNLFQTSRNFTVMFLVTCRFANRY